VSIRAGVSQIFVMNADTTNYHNISGENTLAGWPAWSYDMSYTCDDIDKTYAELQKRGVEFEGPP
jgi:hypothetical protein